MYCFRPADIFLNSFHRPPGMRSECARRLEQEVSIYSHTHANERLRGEQHMAWKYCQIQHSFLNIVKQPMYILGGLSLFQGRDKNGAPEQQHEAMAEGGEVSLLHYRNCSECSYAYHVAYQNPRTPPPPPRPRPLLSVLLCRIRSSFFQATSSRSWRCGAFT